jgi:hypothetical protein
MLGVDMTSATQSMADDSRAAWRVKGRKRRRKRRRRKGKIRHQHDGLALGESAALKTKGSCEKERVLGVFGSLLSDE